MASAELDRILQKARRLPPDERRRLRDARDREDRAKVRPSDRIVDLSRELLWIEEPRWEYAGRWVAVRGDRLLSSSRPDGREVYRAARAGGDERPFINRVEPADNLPFAGW